MYLNYIQLMNLYSRFLVYTLKTTWWKFVAFFSTFVLTKFLFEVREFNPALNHAKERGTSMLPKRYVNDVPYIHHSFVHLNFIDLCFCHFLSHFFHPIPSITRKRYIYY